MKVKAIFISIFFLLGYYVSQLHLYIDDYLFLYNPPLLTHNFFTWFSHYTTEFGIYRPIATIYYHFIFSLYQFSPILAHLLPWALQVFSGYLLYQILLRQCLSNYFSLILGIIFVLHPFASESYMWLGANQGTLVSFIFLLQILLIQKNLPISKTAFLLVILSTISALTYESTLLFFIPLLYLLSSKYPSKIFKLFLLNLIPILIFLFTKFLITPQNPRPLVNNFSSLFNNSQQLFKNLFNVHFDSYYQNNFWTNYTINGYLSFIQTPALLIVLLFLIAFILVTLIQLPKNSTSSSSPLYFWLLTFLCCLPPLVVNQTFYFGFRSLFLPSITGIIFLFFLFQTILKKNSLFLLKLISFSAIPLLIFINANIANQYEQMSQNDTKLAQNIVALTPSNATIILQSKISLNSQSTFLHADHLISCFYYEWCAPAILNSVDPNNHRSIAIQRHNNSFAILPNTNLDILKQQKPLFQLIYQSDRTLNEIN